MNVLTVADSTSVPRKKVGFYKFWNFWWNVEASELKNKSIEAHQIWHAIGRPPAGDCYINMFGAKALYKKCMNKLRDDNVDTISNELNDCLINKDSDNFWNCWRSKCGTSRVLPHSINGLSDNVNISESFNC